MVNIAEITKEVKHLENIKEVIDNLPVDYNIADKMTQYMKGGMDGYKAMQTIKDEIVRYNQK
ncbi:MAG: hypothetical protein KAR20_02520 [Candidatus Heimdallarchaeota archaeon]|nr:hypothetical protein [Candidatus Heimdallarchaeota archaeon]